MVFSCLYVSQSNLRSPGDQEEIKKIIEWSQIRNEKLNITGALLSTSGRFAQIFEGSEPSVAELMRSIESDPRHRNVRVIWEETRPNRRFSQWRMAYQGPSIYVDRHIKPLLQDLLSERQAEGLIARLIELMSRNADSVGPELSSSLIEGPLSQS